MSENIEKAPNVPPFVSFVTSTVPMVFDNSLSYYEALSALWKWLQDDVVDVINNNATVTQDYINLTNELKSFVENYFNNLDVQEEINNKLDAMVSDGTFEIVIGEYFHEQFDILDNKIDDTATTLENDLSTAITSETNARTSADSNLQAQINALGSGAPIPVANTSAMTNHSKVYVNTTDGKWYYWNGSAWAVGGTYQSTGLASGSVYVSSLNGTLKSKLFTHSTDVSKLQRFRESSSGTAANVTSPMFILAGTTITFSNDFVANYQWSIVRLTDTDGYSGNIKAYSTDTSYQFTTDEACGIFWKPIDSNWSTTDYTVDRMHKLDSNDVTGIDFYYPKYSDICEGINDSLYTSFSFMKRTLASNGLMYAGVLNRWGSTCSFKTSSKVQVEVTDSRFQYAVLYVSDPTETDTGTYHVDHDSGWINAGVITTIPANTEFVIQMRLTADTSLSNLISDLRRSLKISAYSTFSYIDDVTNVIPDVIPDYDKYVKGINHRGYNTVAPENTIPAFKMSAEEGFKYVESDVQFTSDSVPVMIHDTTIDRTSNGSGNVADMTYSQISQYDFGSWKSSAYAGTKIPTLDEFLKCCKDCGLTPYIELKTPMTDAQYQIIASAVKKFGMENNVTYISFQPTYLAGIHAKAPKARLGIVLNNNVTDTAIASANNLKGDNEVFIDLATSYITTENVNKCINNDLPLEVWTPNTDQAILALPDYVTGVTSDIKIAGKVFFDDALGD